VTFSSIHLDLTAFGFAAALTLVTGILFGLVPAIQATRPSLTAALKEGTPPARALGGFRWPASRSVLAAVEIALALVLLAGSGLMLRSLANLLSVEPGFEPDRLLSLRLNLSGQTKRDSMPGFYDQVVERLGALPGVTGVAIGSCPPLSGGCNGTVVDLRDRPAAKQGTEPTVGVHWITPTWPAVMKVPLESGRLFNSSDRLGGRKAVLVSHTAARKLWPGQDPIGRPVGVGQGGFWKDTAYVAGVIGDVRFGTLDSLPAADVYLPYAQSPNSRMMIFVRTAGDPLSMAPTVRAALRELAPDLPVYDMRTMSSRVADAAARARQGAVLLALFAGVALVLATMGIYSVISFGVTQRTREIGIRVALGASRGEVLRLVVGQGTALAVVGGALGLGAAFMATRVLQSLLFGIQPLDPVTFALVVALLGSAAVLASWIPARRAAGVDPVVALREG
jgi:putative ABC transport system permease protein